MPLATQRKRRLGDILVEQGVITPIQLDEALQRQRLTGDMLGRTLVSLGYGEEQDVIDALGLQLGMEKVDLAKVAVADDILRLVTGDVARFYNVIPLRVADGALIVAMADPLNLQTLDDLQQITGMEVRGAISNPEAVAAAWKKNYAFEAESIHKMLEDIKDRVGELELSLEELGVQEVVADPDNLIELAQQPEVINGASDFMVAVFGDKGRHARAAVSAGALPRGVAVEIDCVAEVE